MYHQTGQEKVEKEVNLTLPQCYSQSRFLRSSEKTSDFLVLAPAPPALHTELKVLQAQYDHPLCPPVGFDPVQTTPTPPSLTHPVPPQTVGPRGQTAGPHCPCWPRPPRPQSWPRRRCGRAARVLENGGKPRRRAELHSQCLSNMFTPRKHCAQLDSLICPHSKVVIRKLRLRGEILCPKSHTSYKQN